MARPGVLHPDDESDPVLAITYTILDRVDNRAMSVKELGEAAYNQGLMRTRYGTVLCVGKMIDC